MRAPRQDSPSRTDTFTLVIHRCGLFPRTQNGAGNEWDGSSWWWWASKTGCFASLYKKAKPRFLPLFFTSIFSSNRLLLISTLNLFIPNIPINSSNMQPLVNYGHSTCPSCQATIAGGGKTCSACGAVSLHTSLLPVSQYHAVFVLPLREHLVFDESPSKGFHMSKTSPPRRPPLVLGPVLTARLIDLP